MRTILLLGSTTSVKLLANRPMPYSTPPNTPTAKGENIKTKTPREKMKRNDFPVSICICSLKFKLKKKIYSDDLPFTAGKFYAAIKTCKPTSAPDDGTFFYIIRLLAKHLFQTPPLYHFNLI